MLPDIIAGHNLTKPKRSFTVGRKKGALARTFPIISCPVNFVAFTRVKTNYFARNADALSKITGAILAIFST